MTYASCPQCGMRIRTRGEITPWRCPRCLARRGAKVELVRTLQREQGLPERTSQPPATGPGTGGAL
jgi:tRNA(Ile2) C34 agmatinyltransferase TiaS